jgi:hypothetical protein
MLKKIFTLLLAVLILSALGCATVQNPKAETDAVESAKAWLALIDDGKYADNWNETAEIYKSDLNKEQWAQMAHFVRKPLGYLISRKTKNTTYKTSLPGAPKGQYVIVHFKTSFENRKSALEKVTLMLDKDGNWRVSGYDLRVNLPRSPNPFFAHDPKS